MSLFVNIFNVFLSLFGLRNVNHRHPPLIQQDGTSQPQLLFIGDSLLEYWVCLDRRRKYRYNTFSPTTRCRELSEDFVNHHLLSSRSSARPARPARASPVELCKTLNSSRGAVYCNSGFHESFPGSTNLALSGRRICDFIWMLASPDVRIEMGMNCETSHHPSPYERLAPRLREAYTAVVIEIGTKDISLGTSIDSRMEQYARLVSIIRGLLPSTPILLLSVLPRPAIDTNQIITRTNGVLREHFASMQYRQYQKFYDLTTAFSLPNGEVNTGAYLDDQLHLSARGFEILTAEINLSIRDMKT
jgi:GDSL-like Lipase/Acylhydrolase family